MDLEDFEKMIRICKRRFSKFNKARLLEIGLIFQILVELDSKKLWTVRKFIEEIQNMI